MIIILTCKLGDKNINCIDGKYNKEQLKKWSSKNILKCPVCGKSYEYCHGLVKMPYFRHKDKVVCTDKYSESETEEHLLGKRDLYEWISRQEGVSNVILEAWIPETKQRPDIMFDYNGEKWVIEYQCSSIVKEYFERHDLYQAAEIHDIWICGSENYLKPNMRIKELEKYCDGYYNPYNQQFIFSDDYELRFIISKTSAGQRLNISIEHLKNCFNHCSIPISDTIFLKGQIVYRYIPYPVRSFTVLERRNSYKKYSNITMHKYLSNKCTDVSETLTTILGTTSDCSIDMKPLRVFRDNYICIQGCLSFSTPWGLKNEYISKRLPAINRNQYHQQLLSLSKYILDVRKQYYSKITSISNVIQSNQKIRLIVGFYTKQRQNAIQESKQYTQYFKKQALEHCNSNYDFIYSLANHISRHRKLDSSACVAMLPHDISINNHHIDLHRYHEDIIIKYLQRFGFDNVTVVHDRENIFEYIPQEDI